MATLVRTAAVSKAVFGSEHMLAIMTEIAQAPEAEFTAPAIEAMTGLAGSVVHGMLSRLRRAGLVTVVGHVRGQRTLEYERRDHVLWQAATQLTSEARDSLSEGEPRDL
jgi:hypothetical protein